MSVNPVKITIIQNGPAKIECEQAEVTAPDGSTTAKHKTLFICRCAQSKHQPYCDGGHKGCDFDN